MSLIFHDGLLMMPETAINCMVRDGITPSIVTQVIQFADTPEVQPGYYLRRNPKTGEMIQVRKWREAKDKEEKTPRQRAAIDTARSMESDYIFARKSSVPNAGEDIVSSARHLRNRWTTLANAEKEGSAANLVNREQLLKNEPPQFGANLSIQNSLGTLAAYLAMQKFPARPENRYTYWDRNRTALDRRQDYYQAYQNIKNSAQAACVNQNDPILVLETITQAIRSEINRLRSGSGQRNNAIANDLINMQNRCRPDQRRPGKLDVKGQVLDFASRLRRAYGEVSGQMLVKARDHVADVLEGESFNKTFGTVDKKTGFNPADAYVKIATRRGGRMVDADSVANGTNFMLNNLKLRGIQFGNSVTDDERQHHLKCCSEAMADLADVTGLPDHDIGLNGRLGIAFGARGKANALAHYEPKLVVINLTRKHGVGSLAHEWFHFMDNQLASDQGRHGSMMTGINRNAVVRMRPAEPLHGAFYDLMQSMESFRGRLRDHLARHGHELNISSKKANGYWLAPHEMAARAFEKHTMARLTGQGRENTYLAGLNKKDLDPHVAALWPNEEETKTMAPFFDAIFAHVRTRKGVHS